MNWTLMRKDFRLLRPVFIGIAAMALMFYVGFAVSGYFDSLRHRSEHGNYDLHPVASMALGIQNAAVFVTYSLPLWAAMMGGMAFAYERREQWSTWIALLPVRRGRVIGVKLTACVFAYLGLLAANALGVLLGWVPQWATGYYVEWHQSHTWPAVSASGFAEIARGSGSLAAAMFGIAWLLSSILRSAVLSACISIGLTMGGMAVFGAVVSGHVLSDAEVAFEHFAPWVVGAVAVGIGAACERWRTDP